MAVIPFQGAWRTLAFGFALGVGVVSLAEGWWEAFAGSLCMMGGIAAVGDK